MANPVFIHLPRPTQNKSEGGLNDTLASWASVMGRSDSRFQQPDGLRTFSNSRRLPNVHRTKSEGDSVRGLKRSTSVSPSTGGLQRHNSVRSNGTETVVEVPVHGVNYYSLSSVRAAHHGLRKKRSVTDPNADTALDELDMSDGGSVKSGRSTRSGRVQKIRQRGDSITSRIRKEATSIADDVHTSRYRSLRRSHSIRSTPY
ncbi:hypothetical protein DIPPA_35785 [Diplonema papillatum]|nr:hypothetical protein DIPPA_35785 [Diplonema papillatum]